jgi:hypothetical protein
MPSRAPAPRVGRTGGFGGFTPNPSIAYPGGRVLASDVEQARGAMEFGATPSPTVSPTASPRSTPTPSVTINPSDTGYASATLNPRVWSIHDQQRFSPETSGSVAANASVDSEPIPSRGGRSPMLTGDPNEDWRGNDAPQLAENNSRGDGLPSEPGMDNGPSLFDDPANQQPSLTINPSGGQPRQPAPIYRRPGQDIANFGGNMTLGQFLNTPLAMLRFGGDHYPAAVGSGTVRYAGTEYQTPGEQRATPEAEANFAAAEARGAEETARLRASGQLNPEGTTGLIGSGGTSQIGSHWDYGQGRYVENDNATGAQFDSHAANAMTMWAAGFAGSPNDPGTTSDEGLSRFYSGRGSIDAEGVISATSDTGRTATPESMASRNLYQQALAAVPMGPRGFTADYVARLSDWIAQHQGKG